MNMPLSFVRRAFSIRNKELPICSTCAHFIAPTHNYPYDPIPSDADGRCKKFGEVNMISGAIEYDFASECRFNAAKCGTWGLEHTLKQSIQGERL